MSLRHRERIDIALPVDSDYEFTDDDLDDSVEHEGTELVEIEVWNFLNVDMPYQFSGGNPTMETFPDLADVEIGGSGPTPDYVTSWVAEELWHEISLDRLDERFGIEVINMDDDDVIEL